MLDIKLIREKTEQVKKALLKKRDEVDLERLIRLDDRRRELILSIEGLRENKNKVSDRIPALKKEGKDVSALLQEMKDVSARVKDLENELAGVKEKFQENLIDLPNIPDDDVPAGGKENNAVERTIGKKPEFPFKPRDHVELVTSLGLVDYERGVKMGGNGYWLYTAAGARLEWGLLNYFIEQHLADGYRFILPPHILNYACGYTAGQFPKFTEDVFRIAGGNGEKEKFQFLLPTAETALVNLFRDEIIPEEELPVRCFAYTPCYRKEAGSYRTGERGMIRGHQFNKVELFQFTRPEDSERALGEMIGKAEKLVSGLGLHYRVALLAARDCTSAMAKTYDIEVWIPSMNEYKEVSSASNARDYQARRGSIRFRRTGAKKPELVNTLNASGLATSRLIPAIVEQFQQKDGSVVVPEVLRKWVGGEVLKK